MKKLCVFIGNVEGGGAEKSAVHIANGLSEAGVTVQLVLAEKKGVHLGLVSPSVEIIDLQGVRLHQVLLAFIRYLRREKPDAILTFMPPCNAMAIVANLITGKKSRLVITEHCNYSRDLLLANPLASRILKTILARILYPLAHAIIAVSEGMARDLERYAGYREDRVAAVYNLVITPAIMALAKEPSPHAWLDGNHAVILSVGRLHPQKNMALLIRAFADIRKTRAAKLIILGEGPLRAELEALVATLGLQDDIALPGFQANPYAYMTRADVFVLASDFEGLGNVLVEALACDMAVVATDCESGPAETLGQGEYGALVPVGDRKKLAAAIVDCLDNPAKYKTMARQFQSNAMQQFTQDYAVRRYMELLFVPPKK